MDAQLARLDALRATGWIIGSLAALSGLLGPVLAGGLDPTSMLGIVGGSGVCVVAAIIIDRQPSNRAAWAFLVGGLLLVGFALCYSVAAGRVRAGDLSPEVGTVAATAEIVGTLAGGSFPLFQFLFPNGQLPSRRWRPVFAVYLVGWLASGAAVAVALWPHRVPGIVADNGPVDIAIPAELTPALQVIAGTEAFAALAMLVGLASIMSRLRGARGVPRRQVLLALWGIAMTALLIAATAALDRIGAHTLEGITVLCAPLPLIIAVALAMRRHRLFDVERLVGQTLTYATVTALLVGLYASITIGLGALTGVIGVQPSVTVAAATLAVAGAFRPVLRRVRTAVDRHFDRRTWLAIQTIEGFTRDLRGGKATSDDLVTALRRSVDDPHAVVAYVDGATTVDGRGAPVDLGDPRPGRFRRTIIAGDDPVAIVDLDERLRQEPRLMEAVLAAAALPLENAALHACAAVHLAQVEASRSRIVEADDTSRRRIERDLHDGAQQRLVALALRLRIAERELAPTTPQAAHVLADAVVELRATVNELRELTRGILPPVLADEGLSVALRTATSRLPLPVTLDVCPDRFPPIVEATVWYVACEGMANAAKHANARSLRVQLRRDGDTLILQVADDGAGGATITPGGGLQGLADRVAAVGGELSLTSLTGGGTRVQAELPCRS